MARSPTDSRRRRIQAGEGRMATSRMTRAVYRGQASGSTIRTDVIPWMSSRFSVNEISGLLSFRPVMAATSRATPIMDRQSERFGVTPMSRTVSRKSKASARSCPGCSPSGRIRMPVLSGPMPSSSSEHSMPSERSPRMSERLMV